MTTLKSKMKFLTNAANDIPFRVVNEACERCGIFDCRERVAAPTVLQKKRQFASMKVAMEKLK